MKRAIVTGSSGFLGGHLVRRLKNEGYWVCGMDFKVPEFREEACDAFIHQDLRHRISTIRSFSLYGHIDEVYALAADMGGALHVFSGDNDADILQNSAQINLNTVEACRLIKPDKIFFASSACVYPDKPTWYVNPLQNPPTFGDLDPACAESEAYPANPDSDYGWEKLFSERLYQAYARNYDLNVKIGRFHNVFGPYGTWQGGREKAPAAICRKVAQAKTGDLLPIWGDGTQIRSFLYVDEAIEGVRSLMASNFAGPVNIGSSDSITVANLVHLVARIAGKEVEICPAPGPIGVRGRNSDNTLIRERLGWAPSQPLEVGLRETYRWIAQQVKENA